MTVRWTSSGCGDVVKRKSATGPSARARGSSLVSGRRDEHLGLARHVLSNAATPVIVHASVDIGTVSLMSFVRNPAN
jgi:hypothetical protein